MRRKWHGRSLSSCVALLVGFSLVGCGGSEDDFSKPLVMPKSSSNGPESSDMKLAPTANAAAEAGRNGATDQSAPADTTSEVSKQDGLIQDGAKSDVAVAAAANSTSPTMNEAQSTSVSGKSEPKSEPMPVVKDVPLPSARPTQATPVATTIVAKTGEPMAELKTVSNPQQSARASGNTELVPLSPEEREWLNVKQWQACSADGQFVVSAVSTKRLRVHDIRSRTQVSEFYGQPRSVTALAVGPLGQWIIAADDAGSLRLWSSSLTTTGLDRIAREALQASEAAQPTIKSEQGIVRAMLLSPDARSLFTAGEDGSLQHWSIEASVAGVSLKSRQRWVAHQGEITALKMSTNGKALVSGGQDRHVKLWDAATGELQRDWIATQATISDVAVTGDGERVAASTFGKVVSWWPVTIPTATAAAEKPTETSKPIGNAKPSTITTTFEHPDWVVALSWSADGKQLMTSCRDRSIRVWDVSTGRVISRPEAAKHVVVEMRSVAGEQRLLNRDRAGVIRNRPRVAIAGNDDEDVPQTTQAVNSEWVFESPSELLSLASVDATTSTTVNPKLEMLLSNLRVAGSRNERDQWRAKYFSSSASFSTTDTAKAAEDEETELPRWKPPVNSTEKSDRPQLIGSISTAFDFAPQVVGGHRSTQNHAQLALTAEGEFLTIVSGVNPEAEQDLRRRTAKGNAPANQVWVWDVATQGLLRHWDDLATTPSSLKFVEARNQFVATSTPHWMSLVTGLAIDLSQIGSPTEKLHRVAVSPDGQRIAVTYVGMKQATNKVVRLFDAETLKEVAAFEAFEAMGTAIEFLPDSSSMLVGIRERSAHKLLMLDVTNLAVQSTLEEVPHAQTWLQGTDQEHHSDRGIGSIVISWDGRAALTTGTYGSGDFRLNFWDRRGSKWQLRPQTSAKAAQPIVDDTRCPLPLLFVGGKVGQLLAINQKGLGLLDTHNGRIARSIELKDGSKERGPYAWSGDGNWLAQADNAGHVALWNLRLEKEPGYFAAHLGPIKTLALSQDGQLLATLGEENQLHLWSLSNWLPKNRVVVKKSPTKPTPSAD